MDNNNTYIDTTVLFIFRFCSLLCVCEVHALYFCLFVVLLLFVVAGRRKEVVCVFLNSFIISTYTRSERHTLVSTKAFTPGNQQKAPTIHKIWKICLIPRPI